MASARTLIASTTLGSNAASVTFSGIPGTYKDLIVQFSARLNTAESPPMFIRFNGDTSANYSRQFIRTSYNATNDADRTANTSVGACIFYVPGPSGTANAFGTAEITIPGYTASTAKQIGVLSSSPSTSTTSAEVSLAISCGTWQGTAAITSLTIYNSNPYDLVTNSAFYLYGLAG